MHNHISDMLTRYERGEIRRRDLISGLAALTVASRGTAAPTSSTFQGVEVNHVALNVTDVRRSRDFYQTAFAVSEFSQGSGDLNGDGDALDLNERIRA